jgi:hypothetical protein
MSSFLSLTDQEKKQFADNTYNILTGTKTTSRSITVGGKLRTTDHIPEISIITHHQSINLKEHTLNKFFEFLEKNNLYSIDPTNNNIVIDPKIFQILQYDTRDDKSKFGYVLYLTEAQYKDFQKNLPLQSLYNDMSKIIADPSKTIESIKYSLLSEAFNPSIGTSINDTYINTDAKIILKDL